VLRHRFFHRSWCYENRGSPSLIAVCRGLLGDPSQLSVDVFADHAAVVADDSVYL